MRRLIIKKCAAAAVAVAILVGVNANAAFYDLNPPAANFSVITSQLSYSEIVAAIGTYLNNPNYSGSDLGIEIYKSDVTQPPTPGGAESGTLAGSYTTAWTPPDGSGNLTITYDGGAFADASWLVLKDGQFGGYLFWDIASWNGTDTIRFLGDPMGTYDISHVAIYGAAVPEPGTMIAGALLLLPFAASTIRFARKNRKA